MRRMWQAIGWILAAVGGGAVIESQRVDRYKAAFGFGSGTFPMILGGLLVAVGVYIALTSRRWSAAEIAWPAGPEARAILASLVTLVLYALGITLLGYYLATFLAAAALYRIFGPYSWPRSVLGAAITTAVLYVALSYVAGVPLPAGALT